MQRRLLWLCYDTETLFENNIVTERNDAEDDEEVLEHEETLQVTEFNVGDIVAEGMEM